MTGELEQDNSASDLPEQWLSKMPRMVGESDIALLRQCADFLTEGAKILEFGPWLGGVTTLLTEYGDVTVVDRFEWSELNDKAYPGVLEVGADFRPLFEAGMARAGTRAHVHVSDFRDYLWEGGSLGLVYIDAPRDAKGLLRCLRAAAPGLSSNTRVLVKHGFGLQYPDMMSLIEWLAGQDIVVVEQLDQPVWNTTSVLRVGENAGRLSELAFKDINLDTEPLGERVSDGWNGRLLTAARLARLAKELDWPSALRQLQQVPEDPAMLTAWDRFEAELELAEKDPRGSMIFAELLAEQADPSPHLGRLDGSLSLLLRNWWRNTAGYSWQTMAFRADRLETALSEGHMQDAARFQHGLRHAHVLEIGHGLTGSGIGYVAAGAASYLGLEMGDLTGKMMQIEAAFEPITYLPGEMLKPEQAQLATHCFVHQEALGMLGMEARLQQIASQLPPDAKKFVIDARNGVFRPWKPKAREKSSK